MPAPTAAKTLIHVKDVRKSFNDKEVLQGISLDVAENEILAIIGTSGCGKSTLLKIISGLEEADSGEVHLDDPNYSMVFQYSALFDSLTIFENVGFSLLEKPDLDPATSDKKLKREPQKPMDEIEKIVREKLQQVGLEDVGDKYPNELSGGMKKRVSFARAIVSNPRIILYDEPTAGLDPIASTVIEDYIEKLCRDLKAASIVVTHQFSTIKIADRVVLLHDGKVQWQGTPDELLASDNEYAKQFAHASLEGPMAPR